MCNFTEQDCIHYEGGSHEECTDDSGYATAILEEETLCPLLQGNQIKLFKLAVGSRTCRAQKARVKQLMF
jgi:hypothetical protein